MSISLSGQLLSLAAGLLLGVGVGLLYDLLRQLRLLAPRRWMAEGLDLLFWLLAWRSFSAVFSSAAGRSGCIWSSG